MDKLYFVIFPEDGVWVAHGLQKNIVTHGESLTEIRENISAIFEGYSKIVSKAALDRIPPAEDKHWQMWLEAVREGRDLDDYLDTPVDSDESFMMELQTA